MLSLNRQTSSYTPPTPLIDNKRGEPKMTRRLAALVKWVAELRAAGLQVCHCVKEFTLR
jgi:hypothetical protein